MKYTTEEFIKKANLVHHNFYDYSETNYIDGHKNIIIICPKHGKFTKLAYMHLQGQGCPVCSGSKITTEEFIKKAKEIHSDKYDYSKVEYKNVHTKVCIICSEHGEFWQNPNSHLQGYNCLKCAKKKSTKTRKQFITDARKIHGDKYDYSKVDYKNAHTKVCIICPEHGKFWQKPNTHLNGYGCINCAGLKKLTTQQFIEKAKKIHDNKYNYSKVEYVNSRTKVCIICSEHGEFWQTANDHLQRRGCMKCVGLEKSNTQQFIKKAKEIHGDKYDYSKVDYKNNYTKVCILCPEHEEFWQRPYSHLQKQGCLICANEKKGSYKIPKKEEFIKKAREIHGDKYDYSKVKYVNMGTKIKIICSEHGKFWQKPSKHINQKQGCPICNESIGEKEISSILENNNIKFERQKTFNNCKNINVLPFDFYLPDYNLAIEYDGIQHFEPVEYFGGESGFIDRKNKDKIKDDYCKDNNIHILRIPYWEKNISKLIMRNKNEL